MGRSKQIRQSIYTGDTGGIAEGAACYISADGKVLPAIATSDNAASRYVGVAPQAIAEAGSGEVRNAGPAKILLEDSLTPVAGEPVYLGAATAGKMTNVKPATAGNVILVVAYIKDASIYVSGTNPYVLAELGIFEGRHIRN